MNMLDQQIIFALDKVGILAFSFTGVAMGVGKKLDIFGLLVVGVASAIGGGIIRDLILARVPFVLRKETYATIAATGGLIIHLLFKLGLSISYCVILGLIVIIFLRFLSIRKNFHLPVIR